MNNSHPTSYLDDKQLPYLFCPGCGHGKILDNLDAALIKLALDPRKTVIVTDIGCAGLSDRYFNTNAFHGLHGRSITYATGIKLSDPDLKVIVLIGDGGCGIGGHHLLNAARRNIGITTLVFNNLNYGMTGGEHSVTTPIGGITSTTRLGQLEHPLDICGTVIPNGATFVARTTTFNKNLANIIAQGIQNEGFSVIDIWELCTAHYVPNNKFSKKNLESTLEVLEYPTGILKNETKPEYSRTYRAVHEELIGDPVMSGFQVEHKFSSSLTEPRGIILAGAAGTKIASAASIFGYGAVLSGLWASQRDDYPVTVKSGHSISEVIISPTEIRFTGITQPDLMVVLFPEGLEKSRSRIAALTENDILVISADLPDVVTPAQKITLNFNHAGTWGKKKEYHALMAITVVLQKFNLYPLAAFKEAISMLPKYSKENLAAVDACETFGLGTP